MGWTDLTAKAEPVRVEDIFVDGPSAMGEWSDTGTSDIESGAFDGDSNGLLSWLADEGLANWVTVEGVSDGE